MATYAQMIEQLFMHAAEVKGPSDVEVVLHRLFPKPDVDSLMQADLFTLLQTLSVRDVMEIAVAVNKGGR